MATLTVQKMSFTGLEAVYTTADVGGDEFVNDERTIVHVINGGGSDITVTVTAQETVANKNGFGDIEIADTEVVCTAGEERFIGPFPSQRFNNKSTGLVQLSYSGVTSVTIAAMRLDGTAR